MPIKIPDTLPAYAELAKENIFVISEKRAFTQDIRPLKIAILNLMPTKTSTEIQLMRMLSNTPLQIDVTLVIPSSHESRHTSHEYLDRFYQRFDEIEGECFDGLIITGQGPGAAMLFSLVVLAHLMDERVAHGVANGMIAEFS